MPVYVQPALVVSYGMHKSPLHPGHATSHPRTQTFFFAGMACLQSILSPLFDSQPFI